MSLLHVLLLTSLASGSFVHPRKHLASVHTTEDRSSKGRIGILIKSHDGIRRLNTIPMSDIWSKRAKIVTMRRSEGKYCSTEKANIDENSKIYHDPKVGAVLRVRGERIDGILDHEWSIQSENKVHYIFKLPPRENQEKDYLEVPKDDIQPDSYKDYFEAFGNVQKNYAKALEEIKFKAREVKSYKAEITVVVDSTLAHQIGEDDKIYEYLTIFWNGVNQRYMTIDNPLITINLVGAVILRNPEDEPFIQNNILGDNKIISSRTLANFSKWVYENKETIPPHDIAFLQTSMNMVKDNGDGQLSGLAYRGASCKRKGGVSYGTAMAEDLGGYYHGVSIAAHEIAHNLGAPHDGDQSKGTGNCSWFDGYIMSYETGTVNQLFFSECSKKSMRTYLSSLPALCLKLDVSELWLTNELPGDNLSMDEQCQHLTGKRNAYVDTSVTPQDNLCFNLVCKYQESLYLFTLETFTTAAENTPCPFGGKCRDGKCIYCR